jgi:hypothetical protein
MADTTTLRAPQHLSKAQRAFWRHVMGVYELDQHHVKPLTLLCEALDRGDQARRAIARDGAYLPDRFGQLKAHPAVAVERDARIAVARLTRELDLDGTPEPDPRPPRHPSVRLTAQRGRLMPRRRRTNKRRDELSLDRMVALTLGPTPGCGEPDEGLEDAYPAPPRSAASRLPPRIDGPGASGRLSRACPPSSALAGPTSDLSVMTSARSAGSARQKPSLSDGAATGFKAAASAGPRPAPRRCTQ